MQGRSVVLLLSVLSMLSCLTACASSDKDKPATSVAKTDAGGTDAASVGPTFHKDVEGILRAKCQSCHVAKGIAPFPLTTYLQAKAMAAGMVSATATGLMPPWGAQETASCKPRLPFSHDLRLSATELAVFQTWSSAGAPEGNPADLPAGATVPNLELANVDQTASPKAPFVASGDADLFRCFVLDTAFAQRKYLNGIQITAGNKKVVHHVLVFTAPEKAIAKKALDADGGYPCFGSTDLVGQQLVGAWAPGAIPLEYPPDAGAILEAGTRLVMQVHYHPAGKGGESDLTQVQLRYTKGEPVWRGLTALIGNFEKQDKNGDGLQPGPNDQGQVQFRVPAGATNHTEKMRFTIPTTIDGKPTPALRVYGVGTHMHYVGRDMRIEVDRSAAGQPACTLAQLGPLQTCTQVNCAGKAGSDLAACAIDKCESAASVLTAACGDCLQAEILKPGATEKQVFTVCQTPPPQPMPLQPGHECLLETPAWDFNWQRIYNYVGTMDELPILRAGDQVHLTCGYDNSLANPFVQEALMQQKLSAPKDVVLGETTLDEMCLAVVQILFKP